MSQGKKNKGKFKQNRDEDSKRMSGGCCVVRLLMPLCCVVRIFMSLCTPDDDEGGGGGGGRVCCTSDNELSKFCSLYIRFESPYLDFRRTSLYFSWLVTFRKEMLEFSFVVVECPPHPEEMRSLVISLASIGVFLSLHLMIL